MKDYARKGILAGKVLDTYFAEDLGEVQAETKPSRMGRAEKYAQRAKQHNETRRNNWYDEDDEYGYDD